jgi:hypothetical protein
VSTLTKKKKKWTKRKRRNACERNAEDNAKNKEGKRRKRKNDSGKNVPKSVKGNENCEGNKWFSIFIFPFFSPFFLQTQFSQNLTC